MLQVTSGLQAKAAKGLWEYSQTILRTFPGVAGINPLVIIFSGCFDCRERLRRIFLQPLRMFWKYSYNVAPKAASDTLDGAITELQELHQLVLDEREKVATTRR